MAVSPLNERTRKRVAEITAMAKGNRHQADRLIRAQIDRDPQFLRDLVEPFLDGIVAHALAGAAPRSVPKPQARQLSASGMESLMRGLEGAVSTQHKPSSQASHADTIRALADAQARKRRDQQ